jgi:hypothetical protein
MGYSGLLEIIGAEEGILGGTSVISNLHYVLLWVMLFDRLM